MAFWGVKRFGEGSLYNSPVAPSRMRCTSGVGVLPVDCRQVQCALPGPAGIDRAAPAPAATDGSKSPSPTAHQTPPQRRTTIRNNIAGPSALSPSLSRILTTPSSEVHSERSVSTDNTVLSSAALWQQHRLHVCLSVLSGLGSALGARRPVRDRLGPVAGSYWASAYGLGRGRVHDSPVGLRHSWPDRWRVCRPSH